MAGEAELAVQGELPARQVDGQRGTALAALQHGAQIVAAQDPAARHQTAVEAMDGRGPATQRAADQGDQIDPAVDVGQAVVELAQVDAFDRAVAHGQRRLALERRDQFELAAPPAVELSGQVEPPGDRIEARRVDHQRPHIRALQGEGNTERRRRGGGEAGAELGDRAIEPPAEFLHIEHAVGQGEAQGDVLEAVFAQRQGLGGEPQLEVEAVHARQVDGVAGPAFGGPAAAAAGG